MGLLLYSLISNYKTIQITNKTYSAYDFHCWEKVSDRLGNMLLFYLLRSWIVIVSVCRAGIHHFKLYWWGLLTWMIAWQELMTWMITWQGLMTWMRVWLSHPRKLISRWWTGSLEMRYVKWNDDKPLVKRPANWSTVATYTTTIFFWMIFFSNVMIVNFDMPHSSLVYKIGYHNRGGSIGRWRLRENGET